MIGSMLGMRLVGWLLALSRLGRGVLVVVWVLFMGLRL